MTGGKGKILRGWLILATIAFVGGFVNPLWQLRTAHAENGNHSNNGCNSCHGQNGLGGTGAYGPGDVSVNPKTGVHSFNGFDEGMSQSDMDKAASEYGGGNGGGSNSDGSGDHGAPGNPGGAPGPSHGSVAF